MKYNFLIGHFVCWSLMIVLIRIRLIFYAENNKKKNRKPKTHPKKLMNGMGRYDMIEIEPTWTLVICKRAEVPQLHVSHLNVRKKKKKKVEVTASLASLQGHTGIFTNTSRTTSKTKGCKCILLALLVAIKALQAKMSAKLITHSIFVFFVCTLPACRFKLKLWISKEPAMVHFQAKEWGKHKVFLEICSSMLNFSVKTQNKIGFYC